MEIKPFDDEYFMKQAIVQAKEALLNQEVPVGAVIVCGNKIIAKAHNYTEKLNDVTAHAEMQAFTAAADYLGGKYLNECTLYVTLEPCIMCAGAAYWSRIGRIVYGAEDKRKGFTLFQSNILHKKTKLERGCLKEECSELLLKFFQRKR